MQSLSCAEISSAEQLYCWTMAAHQRQGQVHTNIAISGEYKVQGLRDKRKSAGNEMETRIVSVFFVMGIIVVHTWRYLMFSFSGKGLYKKNIPCLR